MTIEQFSQQEFLQVLKDFAEDRFVNDLGWIQGEKVYSVALDDQVAIVIRSSIHHAGQSAPVGEDSIRLWMTFPTSRSTLAGTRTAKWITRQPGWEKRLTEAMIVLQSWRGLAGDCPNCGKAKEIFVSHTEKNPNREFAKCVNCDDGFIWLDQAATRPQWLRDEERQLAKQKRQNPPGTDFDKMLGASSSNGAVKAESQPIKPESKKALSVPLGNEVLGDNPIEQFFAPLEEKESSFGLGFLSDEPISVGIPVDSAEPKPEKEFIPSKYQLAVFDFVKNSKKNGVVQAVAGSGKTTTIVQALKYTDPNSKVGFLAFNKHIADTLKERAPSHVYTSTLHSLGFKNIRKAYGNGIKVDDHKLWNLAIKLFRDNYDVMDNIGTILRLVDLCKGTLREPYDPLYTSHHGESEGGKFYNLDFLCDHYGLSTNGYEKVIYSAVAKLFDESIKAIEQTKLVDFEDMIYLCAIGEVPCEQFDLLFVDEAQDLNAAQIAMALKSGKRIIAVGDPAQSIYGFRGADTEAIPSIIKALNAETLPLSVSYRCPKKQIRLAKQIVPQIEWRDDAPEGIVENIEVLGLPQPGDLILCRTNAPLIRPCFELIANGIKAAIRGRDIGTGLMQLLDKSAKKVHGDDLGLVFQAIREYTDHEVEKLLRVGKNSRAQNMIDQFETLLALSDGCSSVQEIKTKIHKVFSDDQQAITFSSIHRAKGDESKRVFLLHPELLPHPMCKKDWELKQETNLKYVAITRSLEELYFVGGILQ